MFWFNQVWDMRLINTKEGYSEIEHPSLTGINTKFYPFSFA